MNITAPINEIKNVTDEMSTDNKGVNIVDKRHYFARTLRELMEYFMGEASADFYGGYGGNFDGTGALSSLPSYCKVVYDSLD